jgi:sulfotransferase family protein
MATRSPSSTATQMRLPDFFIVGHFKSGTTSLYEMLRLHPQIFMPDFKEPRFLASDMRAVYHYKRGPNYPETFEEYVSLFAPAEREQVIGEASAGYLWSHTAAEKIAELQPGARIIAILREPAAFLRSFHFQLLMSHIESQNDFRKAIELEAPRREGKRIPRRSHLPQLLQYSDQVRYTDQLRRYYDRFPRDRILVLIHDDFRADNDGTVKRVLRFLDVADQHPVRKVEVKVTKRYVRSQLVDDLTYWVPRGGNSAGTRAAKAAIKAVTWRGLRRGTVNALGRRVVHGELPAPDEGFMLELRRRFKPEVVALSEYLDRDLVTLWGYDEL